MKRTVGTKRREDYFVQATLDVKGVKIRSVPCKVFLPDRVTEKPYLEFRPSGQQWEQIGASHEGSFETIVLGFDGQEQVFITAPCVYFSQMQRTHWGPGFCECSLKGEPQHLRIVRHLKTPPDDRGTSLTLWISPNSALAPPMIRNDSYTGDVKYERLNPFSFRISEEFIITFDTHFKTRCVCHGDFRQWSHLVACANNRIPTSQIVSHMEKALPQLDDLLLIASLGSSTRTACLGWEASDNERVITYYRGEYTFPSGKRESCLNEGLVRLEHFRGFLEAAYSAYLKYPNKEVFRSAVMAVVPGRQKILEESFLSMFAALEALILDYRRRENLELVVRDEREWVTLKKSIEKKLKEVIKDKLDADRRAFMYGKLDELNRIPLNIAFDRFCAYYKTDLSGLWPVFRNAGICGLSDIRNRLIHGDPLSTKSLDILWVASEHLRFMLQRILLCMLGWPIDGTEVSKNFLQTYSTAIRTGPQAQATMTECLSQQEAAGE